jgi:hypothetical protein
LLRLAGRIRRGGFLMRSRLTLKGAPNVLRRNLHTCLPEDYPVKPVFGPHFHWRFDNSAIGQRSD